jgi:NAD(P)-dependent dehydrogenase (short-subunit alcohol dehydrogenase family)
MTPLIKQGSLSGQTVLITGAARRLGHSMSLAVAGAGANVVIHYNHSKQEAEELAAQIQQLGQTAYLVCSDLSTVKGVVDLCEQAFSIASVTALVNNASIFSPEPFIDTTLLSWQDHLQVNLTTPYLISQYFARNYQSDSMGKIINMLDWRALRPGKDHFAYTVTKSALAAMTQSMALSLAPRIAVNAIALGALLPPENEVPNPSILDKVPMKRWAKLNELDSLLIYLLSGPVSLTGQIIHLDGGRNLIP